MDSTTTTIQIRPLNSIEEAKAVEELQLEVWNCSEREVLPSLALIPLLDIGGILGFVVVDFFRGREAGRPGSYLLTRTY